MVKIPIEKFRHGVPYNAELLKEYLDIFNEEQPHLMIDALLAGVVNAQAMVGFLHCYKIFSDHFKTLDVDELEQMMKKE